MQSNHLPSTFLIWFGRNAPSLIFWPSTTQLKQLVRPTAAHYFLEKAFSAFSASDPTNVLSWPLFSQSDPSVLIHFGKTVVAQVVMPLIVVTKDPSLIPWFLLLLYSLLTFEGTASKYWVLDGRISNEIVHDLNTSYLGMAALIPEENKCLFA